MYTTGPVHTRQHAANVIDFDDAAVIELPAQSTPQCALAYSWCSTKDQNIEAVHKIVLVCS